MRKFDPTLTDFLSNEEGVLGSVFGSFPIILVPPEASIETHASSERDGKLEARYIVYPVPPTWLPTLTSGKATELIEMGWQIQKDTSGLLNDLLRLAPVLEGRWALRIDEIVSFVCRWGPLWKCVNPEHDDRFFVGSDCYIFHGYVGEYLRDGVQCTWSPKEEIMAFINVIREIRAVLVAARELQEERPVPREARLTLYPEDLPWSNDLSEQKELVSLIIQRHLMSFGGSRVSFNWKQNNAPKLNIFSGIGFIREAWFQVAQLVCDMKGISQCDGCGRIYIRQGRKPKAGQRNFCPECREGDRGSKRAYAQRKRRTKAGRG